MIMNLPRAGDYTPGELQQRFVLHPDTPIIRHAWAPKRPDDTDQTYAFQWDGQNIGEINVTVFPHEHLIIWSRFFPFSKHATFDELVRWYGDAEYVKKRGLWLAITSSSNVVPEDVQGKGLGTLAHILVIRSLCAQLLVDGPDYRTRYFSAGSMKPRLRQLLDRLDVGEMAHTPLPLQEVRIEMERKAKEIFGFTFEELPS